MWTAAAYRPSMKVSGHLVLSLHSSNEPDEL